MHDYDFIINVDPSELEVFADKLKQLTSFFSDISEKYESMQRDARNNQREVIEISRKIVDYRVAVYEEELRKYEEKTHLARGNGNAYYDDAPYGPVLQASRLLNEARDRHKYLLDLCDNSEAYLVTMKNHIDNKLYELGYLINEGSEILYEYYDHVKGTEKRMDDTQYIPIHSTTLSDNIENLGGASDSASAGAVTDSAFFDIVNGGFFNGGNVRNSGGNTAGASKNISALSSIKGLFGSNLPQSKPCSEHSAIAGLPKTKQEWHECDGGVRVFNTPEETGRGLDFSQGKKQGYASTCGCVSCVNVLRLAGLDITEEQLVDYASTHHGSYGTPLCDTGNFDPFANGGTTHNDRKEILAAYGVESELVPATKDDLVSSVCAGKGVIASVRCDYLYYKKISTMDLHAVTVTSIGMKNGKPYSVFVCDSNGLSCVEYPIDHFVDSLTPNRPLNVTINPIR